MLVLRVDGWAIRLTGPVAVAFSQTQYRIDFYPRVEIEPPGSSRPDRPDPLPLHLRFDSSAWFSGIRAIHLDGSTAQWSWPDKGLHLRALSYQGDWHPNEAKVHIGASHLEWRDPKLPGHAAVFKEPSLFTESRLPLELLRPGSKITLEWQAKQGEVLWGERYSSFPERQLSGEAAIEPAARKASIRLGGPHAPRLELLARLREPHRLELRWKAPALPVGVLLRNWARSLGNAGGLGTKLALWEGGPSGLAVRDGKIHGAGKVLLTLPELQPERFSGRIQVEGLSFRWPDAKLAVIHARLSLPFSSRAGVTGTLAARRIAFRQIEADLRPVHFSARPRKNGGFFLKIGEPGHPLPLRVARLPLRIDGAEGVARHAEDGWEYSIESRMKLEPTDVRMLLERICLPSPKVRAKLPPIRISASFPKVRFSDAGLELTGSAKAALFGGTIEISNAGAYHLLGRGFPELDFDLGVNGLQLSRIGSWLNFGEMDGTLIGVARHVVIKNLGSWSPTQYDLLIQAKPWSHSKVVFSHVAMKNLVRLFVGQDVERWPVLATWLAFGYPARLLNGYNIDYAGLHLVSAGGFVTIETLDPPFSARPGSSAFGPRLSSRQHFILKGFRFKMPLNSERYPVIVDASALNDYFHFMADVLDQLSKEKKRAAHPQLQDEDQAEDISTEACVPADT